MLKDSTEVKGKFDTKAHEGIFMRYGIDKTAYTIYILEHNTIKESTNITFDETKFLRVEDDKKRITNL